MDNVGKYKKNSFQFHQNSGNVEPKNQRDSVLWFQTVKTVAF